MNARRARAVAAFVAIVGVLATGAGAAAASGTGGDGLIPYGPDRVSAPFHRIYTFQITCAAVPCKILLRQRFYARRHPLRGLRRFLPSLIIMRQQPPPGYVSLMWYTRAGFDQSRLKADLRNMDG